MRRPGREDRNVRTVAALAFVLAVGMGCSRSGSPSIGVGSRPMENGAQLLLASSTERARRRAFEGAPPVIPHDPFNMSCTACHTPTGQSMPPAGIAPANPHTLTPGLSDASRCRQCHVFQRVTDEYRSSKFVGLPAGVAKGDRATPGTPPTMPHRHFMHENCAACHSGPAARPEFVCNHPDRVNCRQCHVASEAQRTAFAPHKRVP